mmetsp:Transcript_24910/g.36824  ORF Transcript_24910/g.36824 Transcript_24910/m.36824 type:complete len:213 (-) Transcript_24910:1114-1752(-)
MNHYDRISNLVTFLLILPHCNDIIYLQYHLYHLCRKTDLFLLSNQSLKDTSVLHVRCAISVLVCRTVQLKSNQWISLLHLTRFRCSQFMNGIQTTIFCQSHWDIIQCICKRPNSELVDSHDSFSVRTYSKRASDLSGTTTVNNTIILNEIADDTHSIMEGTLSFLDNHFISTTNQYRNSVGIGTVLNDKHALLGITKGNLTNNTCPSKLLLR